MKKLFFIFLLIIINYSLLIIHCKAQLPPFYIWRPVQSPVQAKINSINTQGYTYAVGNNGLFIYTYDYRYSTFRQVPGIKNINLNEIRQTNNIVMKVIVGNNGTIYRFPSDNYTQLTKEASGTNANLMGVSDNKCSMNPPSTLSFRRVAVGTGGTIIQSTWNISIGASDNDNLFSVLCFNQPNSLAVNA